MVSEKIKSIMKDKGITNVELAKHLGMTPQSLSNKMSRDSFSVQDLITILDFMDCKLVIHPKPDYAVEFTMSDTKRG